MMIKFTIQLKIILFLLMLFLLMLLLSFSSATMRSNRSSGFLIFRRFNSQIEYLLLKATDTSKPWTPPKGHAEQSEDDFAAALRETREEAAYTDDDLTIYKDEQRTIYYNLKGKDKIVDYWLAKLNDPQKQPKLSEEHTDFIWLPKNETTSLADNAAFTEMVDYFHDKIENLDKV